MLMTDEKLWETEDVAKYLNIHARTVLRLVEHGELTAYMIGKNYRYKKEDIDTYLKNHQQRKQRQK